MNSDLVSLEFFLANESVLLIARDSELPLYPFTLRLEHGRQVGGVGRVGGISCIRTFVKWYY